MICLARLTKQTIRTFKRTITSRELRKDFGIIFDIDGVMMKGENVIPGAASTIEQLHEFKVPFIFATNGGGMTESVKAKYLTEKLRVPINESQILLSHTPYKSLIQRYKDCRILIIGAKDSLNVAKSYGFYKSIDTTGYIQEHPRLHAFKTYQSKNSQYCNEPISAIMIYSDSYDWYPDLQVCIDLLTAGRISTHGFGQAIPIYQSNDDLLFSTNYAYPRLAGGAFGRCLREIFKSLTGSDLNIITYGKPSRPTYNYAEKMLNDLSPIPLKRFYGIGDNPNSDIKGANKAGKHWTSILVRTGIFNGEGNDLVNPAKYVVNNVHDAVQQIFKVESVSSPIRH